MSADAPRMLAARCLLDVEEGAYSNLAFKRRSADSGLDARGIAFSARLFYGTLERAVTLDWILQRFLEKNIAALDAAVRVALRMGLYQARFLGGVPARAAVDTSAELVKRLRKSSAAGLVNAVLRKALELNWEPDAAQLSDPAQRLSVQYSAHTDVVSLLLTQYGEQAGAILAATLAESSDWARVNTLKTTAPALIKTLRESGIEAQESELENAIELKEGRFTESCALKDGAMRIQSLAAQWAVDLLDPLPGQTVLDCCAAPGGKTLTAAQRMQNSGRIVALDAHENRLALIEKQAAAEGVSIVETICADAATYRKERGFDRVLCDVPCSGLGEMAKKPELRARALRDLDPLAALQRRILENAASLVNPGGAVVYATCTLNRNENERVVSEFLRENGHFKGCPPTRKSKYAVETDAAVRFVPQKDYNEGFFMARFERMW